MVQRGGRTYFGIVAIAPVEDAGCELEVVIEGNVFVVGPERWLGGRIVKGECEGRHFGFVLGWLLESESERERERVSE